MKRTNQNDKGRTYGNDEAKRFRAVGVSSSFTVDQARRHLLQRMQQEQAGLFLFDHSAVATQHERNRVMAAIAAYANRSAAFDSARYQFALAVARQKEQTEDALYLLQLGQQPQALNDTTMGDLEQRFRVGGGRLTHNPYTNAIQST